MQQGLSQRQERLAVIASCVGSILEMYDFVIYGFFAIILAQLFFPQDGSFAAIAKTFAIFAVGYLSRPLGGILFGWFCDRRGRRAGLLYSVILMGVPIFLIGCLPTYHDWGIASAWLLLVLRLLQGLSVGGEFPAGTVFLAEHAWPERRGVVVSLMFYGINVGVLLGSVVGLIVTHWVSHQELMAFAWRIPFWLGGILAIGAYMVRRRLEETPVFTHVAENKELSSMPLVDLFRVAPMNVLKCIGIVAVMAVGVGVIFLYMPTYLHNSLGVSLPHAFLCNTIALFVFTCFIPFAGALSDKLGRKPVFLMGTMALMFLAYPLFHAMTTHDPYMTLWALVCLGFILAFIIGPIGCILVGRFPTSVRTSGVAVTYNISFAIFGGLAPLVVTWLLHLTHNTSAPALYIIVAAIISLIAILFMPMRSRLSTTPVKPLH